MESAASESGTGFGAVRPGRMKLVVGVSGGSGIPYAWRALQALQAAGVETHLIVSSGAKRVISAEAGVVGGAPMLTLADLNALATHTHDDRDLAAGVASGSFRTAGMLVIPCSAGTLAKIAHGFADSLLCRAAHVTLKERRPLVLVVREDPLPRPALSNMLAAHDAGATIMTASPGFYHAPQSVEELLHFVTARVLDQFGLDVPGFRRWGQGEGQADRPDTARLDTAQIDTDPPPSASPESA